MKTKLILVIVIALILGVGTFLFLNKNNAKNDTNSTNPNETTVEFSTTDIEQIPAKPLPGSTLTTETLPVPKDMVTVLVSKYRFARYNTADSSDKVKSWFIDEFKKVNVSQGQPRESGVIVFTADQHRYALYITTVNGATTYVISAGSE